MSATSASTVQVTEEQLSKYREDGFFITDPLFSLETLDNVQSEFQRLWEEDIATAERQGDPKLIEHARLRAFSSQLEKRSEICGAFLHHPQLIALASQIVGDDIDMTWNQFIAKPPSKGKAFAWHQDAYYALNGTHAKNVNREKMLDPHLGVTFWIAITRTTVENGTMWVVPGCHKQGLLPHIYSDESLEWQCQFDSSKKIPAELKRGQVLVFTSLVPHHSGDNISNEVRMAYQIGYGVPGVTESNYGIPVLRNGVPV
ncbi:MAG: phytanoyl-CoA dioxygenase family protein [Chthoniobacterales bacterium]